MKIKAAYLSQFYVQVIFVFLLVKISYNPFCLYKSEQMIMIIILWYLKIKYRALCIWGMCSYIKALKYMNESGLIQNKVLKVL